MKRQPDLIPSNRKTGFTTRWTVAGDATARTVTLPLSNGGSSAFGCTVNWGDGTALSTVTTYNSASRVHTYAADGTYDIEIQGQCEGWSFDNAGDKLKLVAVVRWGDTEVFGGFKYLARGFQGCTNLASLAAGSIPVSGAGPTTLIYCFASCALTAIPAGLLDNCTAVTTAYACFYSNSIAAIPAGLLDHWTSVVDLTMFLYGNHITSTPARLLDNCTAVTSLLWFLSNNRITNIPAGFLDHCTEVVDIAAIWWANPLQAVPAHLLDHCTKVRRAYAIFGNDYRDNPPLPSIPPNLLDYCTELINVGYLASAAPMSAYPAHFFDNLTKCYYFERLFFEMAYLKVPPTDLLPTGTEDTWFLNRGQPVNFCACYERPSFTGVQGTAPALWNCDYGETITLDVAPATDWAPGDTITGQTSGATAVVVSKTSTYVYRIKKHFHSGTDFTLGEVVGVTGVTGKLADQGATRPVFAGTPISSRCFYGAGNSVVSLSNYADIPANWILDSGYVAVEAGPI